MNYVKNAFSSKILITIAILLLFYSVQASENTTENTAKTSEKEYYQVEKAEEIVVTATMSPKALRDCAASVNIVGRKDLDSISSSSALNILNYIPGIFVNRSGDFGRADVDIRGLGQNCRRIAVLVDGKPEKMGLFGCAVSHAFPLDNVQRIEVIKGPASVLYGGEALGGAVNIITRLPKKKFDTEISSFFGSYNTQQYNLKHGGYLNKLQYFLSFDKRKSDGHIENSDYSGYSFTGKLVYDLMKNTSLSLQGKYFDGEKNEPGTIDNPSTDYWNDYKRGAIDISLDHKWNRHEFFIKAYRNFGKHQFSDGFNSRDYTNGLMVRLTMHPFINNELMVGGDLRDFGGKSYGYPKGDWDKTEGSLFLHDEYKLHPQWILSAGLRLQFDSLYGREWCPNFGLVFHISRFTLIRASIAKGFRSPQINELYMYPAANPDLEPERVWNYELGFQQNITDNILLKGSLFHMKGSNLIETVANPDAPPMYIFANSGRFNFYGTEIELEAFFNRNFSGYIAYSYLHTGDFSRGRPGQKVDCSMLYASKPVNISLQGQYITDYYAADFSQSRIPSYFVLNSRIIVSLIKNLDLLVDVNNIFDKEYQIYGEFPGLTAGLYRMPGRNIQVGFRFIP